MKKYSFILLYPFLLFGCLMPTFLVGQTNLSAPQSQINITISKEKNDYIQLTFNNNTGKDVYFHRNIVTVSMLEQRTKLINITSKWLNNEVLTAEANSSDLDSIDKCKILRTFEEAQIKEFHNSVSKKIMGLDNDNLNNSLVEILKNCIFLRKGESFCVNYSIRSLKNSGSKTSKTHIFKAKISPNIYFRLHKFGFEILEKYQNGNNIISIPNKLYNYHKLKFTHNKEFKLKV